MWPKEEIPDDATVFMRLHQTLFRDGAIMPVAFKDHGGGMSVDWSKYASPEETRARARQPAKNAVISMGVQAIRSIEGLLVEHEPVQENGLDDKGGPIPPNRAHSEVFGEKTEERRLKLSRIHSWAIPFQS
jgi:hypothetical protein